MPANISLLKKLGIVIDPNQEEFYPLRFCCKSNLVGGEYPPDIEAPPPFFISNEANSDQQRNVLMKIERRPDLSMTAKISLTGIESIDCNIVESCPEIKEFNHIEIKEISQILKQAIFNPEILFEYNRAESANVRFFFSHLEIKEFVESLAKIIQFNEIKNIAELDFYCDDRCTEGIEISEDESLEYLLKYYDSSPTMPL